MNRFKVMKIDNKDDDTTYDIYERISPNGLSFLAECACKKEANLICRLLNNHWNSNMNIKIKGKG
jgi:hypothetical protein